MGESSHASGYRASHVVAMPMLLVLAQFSLVACWYVPAPRTNSECGAFERGAVVGTSGELLSVSTNAGTAAGGRGTLEVFFATRSVQAEAARRRTIAVGIALAILLLGGVIAATRRLGARRTRRLWSDDLTVSGRANTARRTERELLANVNDEKATEPVASAVVVAVTPEAAGAASDASGLADRRALVVEVDEASRRTLEAQLRDLSIEVTAYSDGPRALEAFEQAHLAGRRFDLVLVDLHLPGMTGMDVAAALRTTPGGSRARVVLLATAPGVGPDEWAQAGVDAVVERPVGASRLGRVLQRTFASPSRPALVGLAVPATQGLGTGATRHRSRLDPEVIEGLRRMGSPQRPDFLRSVAERYAEEGRETVEALRAGAYDAVQVRESAHKLRGASRLVGAARLGDLCESVEQLAREGKVADAAPLIDELAWEFSLVCAALERSVA